MRTCIYGMCILNLEQGAVLLEQKRQASRWGCAAWPLLAGFAWIGFSGWARLILSVRDWYWLNRFGVEPGPAYLAISGALWGLVGLGTLKWVWRRQRRYRLVGMAAALLLAITYWVDRLAFSRPDGAWVNGPFAVMITLAGLGYAFWMLRPDKG